MQNQIKTPRLSLSNKQRVEVARNFNFKCFYCARQFDPSKLLNPQGFFWLKEKGQLEFHIDHQRPLASGGKNDVKNYVFSCSKCNLKKGSKNYGKK